ncbi:TRYPTOPHAN AMINOTRANSFERASE-RELATED PROTEIN 3 [Salix purpurea]|uniref:TRYPTOPHAN AMINOTRANSFERASE-RELATED PROTEIN 3 n=1 Tax=Salix purpurea TaxID=77065 RepID=A0A9Q0PBI5_SALPP|nr:TRYPTOPHAN AMINOTRANSFERASE-RELATED PROTEIN 3 [Salix purpurea]
MVKTQSSKRDLCLVCSLILNIFFLFKVGGEWNLSWSKRAASEAEAVAAISCSGHGRAYLDGLVLDGNEGPACECNTCYGGPDCSQFFPDCAVNADGGDPLFLEPFWMQQAASSALLVAGWHRMSYSYGDQSTISKELERHIRKLHDIVGNAATEGRYVVFGAGSTQLLNAAVYALSPDNSSSPARVVASIPFYPVYELQTDIFNSVDFQFQGDTSLWKNKSDSDTEVIEFVTSPNNPDGQLNKAVLHGPNVKAIHDHAYYWPHFTAIPAPADSDVMIFTLSKLTGHAGSRFGWAIIKDKVIYQRMVTYIGLNTMGVSRDSQLRALKLIKVVLATGGRGIFEFGHETMRKRWEKMNKLISTSKRFSLQKLMPKYCNYFQKIRGASPAYAWLKCEKQEDKHCYAVLQAVANITGRQGSLFYAEDRYVRLSLIRSQDDFDLLLHKVNELVVGEEGPQIM